EIELENKFENMGAQMVREVASKTSEQAGDGTTTATILAHAIVREGAKGVAAGMNPMDLKRGVDRAVDQCSDLVLTGAAPDVAFAIFRVEFAWLIGIGEERDRHFRTDQDDVLEASQYAQRLVDDIGDAFDRDAAAAAAALCACIEALCDEPRAGLLGDLAGECQAIL